jgi:hypothetical protein
MYAEAMPSNITPCWACSYLDSDGQVGRQVCSPRRSSSPTSHLRSTSTTDSRRTIPAISATKLRGVWQRCGSDNTQEWHEALDLIRTINPVRLCTSLSKADASPETGDPQTILLQDGGFFEKTPSITLTSASSTSAPTMNLITWYTFEQNVW